MGATPLNGQQQFRISKIKEIKDYFVTDIKERSLMSKRYSKYVVSFYYSDKSLIVLSVTTGSISIALFAILIGAPAGIASASFSLAFSISTGTVKKLKTTRSKKKKKNGIVMFTRSKLNSIDNKISEALINNKIRHEDLITIINEEKNYPELKGSIRMINNQKRET